jgi:DNA-binding HxlR family transcriptional regulator
MKRYKQMCGVAKALDVVGDRWTLLIVRDLLLGPLRFGELKTSLAGIPSNLLAERLRHLEHHGIVERHTDQGREAYALGDRGLELEAVILALGNFGARDLAEGPKKGYKANARWAVLSCKRRFVRSRMGGRLQLEIGDAPFEVDMRAKAVEVRAGRSRRPDATLQAPLPVFAGLAFRKTSLDDEQRAGRAIVDGDATVVDAFFEALRP